MPTCDDCEIQFPSILEYLKHECNEKGQAAKEKRQGKEVKDGDYCQACGHRRYWHRHHEGMGLGCYTSRFPGEACEHDSCSCKAFVESTVVEE